MQDARPEPLPLIPLCRLISHPAVRPLQNRVSRLAREFAKDGYCVYKGFFLCSLTVPRGSEMHITKEITTSWDPLWRQVNEEFENSIKGTCWADLSEKMFFTWDGNHRLKGWMTEIQRGM